MKALIFDLDGTILDTLVDLMNAVNHALVFYSLPEVTIEHVRKSIGNGTKVLIKRCTPENISETLRDKVFDEFKDYYLMHYCDFTKPYPGIKEMLLELKKKFVLIVATNKDNDLANKIINKHYPEVFKAIQGSYSDQPKKPHPYIIEKALKENNIDKNECLYIGDSNVDVESANNVGIKYLLVNYGYRKKEELKKMCPNDTSISSVEDLYKEIKKWIKL